MGAFGVHGGEDEREDESIHALNNRTVPGVRDGRIHLGERIGTRIEGNAQ
ncbi:hypothetical protein JCM18882A_08280 [Brevibacterium metallidurans]|uniref:Uncharacterized protein n=1 Tax=Brevibacterium metallidurans TaxID=1482676 RepID=A0ABP3C4X0_9MICO